MKVYILTDLEGVTGVVSKEQVFAGSAAYEKACDWLTLDVNAAVEGAIDGGADDVIVLDAHGANGAVNIHHEKIHPMARLIQGMPRPTPLAMLDESCDALIMLGAHAMSGTPQAGLEHTMSSLAWVEMTLNGTAMGEIGLYSAYAGDYGVPLVTITGDDKACEEAKQIVPLVETAVVKQGISRGCALLLSRQAADEVIKESARRGVQKAGSIKPFVAQPPIEMEIEFLRNDAVESVAERDGVVKLGSRRVRYTGTDVRDAVRRWRGG